MNQVPHNTGLESSRNALPHAKHLKATYRLTCDQGDNTIILRLSRVDSQHPASIKWELPVQPSYEGIEIQVLDDGTLKGVCWTNGVISS